MHSVLFSQTVHFPELGGGSGVVGTGVVGAGVVVVVVVVVEVVVGFVGGVVGFVGGVGFVGAAVVGTTIATSSNFASVLD